MIKILCDTPVIPVTCIGVVMLCAYFSDLDSQVRHPSSHSDATEDICTHAQPHAHSHEYSAADGAS